MPKYFAIPAGAAASAGGPTIQEVSVAGPTIITNERDVIVLVNTSAVLVALTFSATPTVGDRVMIVDVTGESHMRRVVITRGGAQLINNATTIVLDIPSGRFTFFFDGTNWLADRPLNWDVTRRVNIDEHFAATPTRAGTLVTPNFSADSGSGGNINSSPSIAGRPGIVSLDTNTSATGRAGLATYGMTAGVGMFLNGGANFADAMARCLDSLKIFLYFLL